MSHRDKTPPKATGQRHWFNAAGLLPVFQFLCLALQLCGGLPCRMHGAVDAVERADIANDIDVETGCAQFIGYRSGTGGAMGVDDHVD